MNDIYDVEVFFRCGNEMVDFRRDHCDKSAKEMAFKMAELMPQSCKPYIVCENDNVYEIHDNREILPAFRFIQH